MDEQRSFVERYGEWAVVEEVLDAVGSTPSFVPGEQVRGLLAGLGTLPRQDQVEALSAAHAAFTDHHETI